MLEEQLDRARKDNVALRQRLDAAMATLATVASPSGPLLQKMAQVRARRWRLSCAWSHSGAGRQLSLALLPPLLCRLPQQAPAAARGAPRTMWRWRVPGRQLQQMIWRQQRNSWGQASSLPSSRGEHALRTK